MLLYSHIITPRLEYIASFIGTEIFGEPIQLTTRIDQFKNFSGAKINYSNDTIETGEFRICSRSLNGSQLLLEKNIAAQQIDCFETNGYKAFFQTEGDFPFDVFAASFYLLSRYEEYLPHNKDEYGRYACQNSLAFRENFLNIPLVNIWLKDLRRALEAKYSSLTTHSSSFTFLPTYDIDIAYSYLHKGWKRTLGAMARSFITGRWTDIRKRWGVLRGLVQDPFDAYEWLHGIHWQYELKPHYFFLVAVKNGKYDKNILPSRRSMRYLIQSHHQYQIGVHPSWKSGDDLDKLKEEISTLHRITGRQITSSRQHYVRFNLPQTMRNLINAGIEKDFSMGYGSINGFRASVASPFYWYDAEKDEASNLLLYPFCFMDANSFFEQKFSAQEAMQELMHYYQAVQSVDGMLITIWHNNFLGSDPLFAGWKETYRKFVSLVAGKA